MKFDSRERRKVCAHPSTRELRCAISDAGEFWASSGVSRPMPPCAASLLPYSGHSCTELLQEHSAGHPKVGQREQWMELHRVLDRPPVAHFHMFEVALDHTKRMFDRGPTAHRGGAVEPLLYVEDLVLARPLGIALESALAQALFFHGANVVLFVAAGGLADIP